MIDNAPHAPTYPSTELLEQDNDVYTVEFLAPNIVTILQPTDQSVNATFF